MIATGGVSVHISQTPLAMIGSGDARYEAESGSNTLAGGAASSACKGCSTGWKVGNVGSGGSVQFNGVTATTAGTHRMTFTYTSADPRSVRVTVNGTVLTTAALPDSGGWEFVNKWSLDVPLNAGSNTIKFDNPSAFAPDIDALTIERDTQAEAGGNTLAGGASTAACAGCSGGSYVVNLHGARSLTVNSLTVAAAGKPHRPDRLRERHGADGPVQGEWRHGGDAAAAGHRVGHRGCHSYRGPVAHGGDQHDPVHRRLLERGRDRSGHRRALIVRKGPRLQQCWGRGPSQAKRIVQGVAGTVMFASQRMKVTSVRAQQRGGRRRSRRGRSRSAPRAPMSRSHPTASSCGSAGTSRMLPVEIVLGPIVAGADLGKGSRLVREQRRRTERGAGPHARARPLEAARLRARRHGAAPHPPGRGRVAVARAGR